MAKPRDKCNKCKTKFKMTEDNTVAYLYSNAGCEDYSYYTAVCTECETKNWTFCKGYLPELMEIIRSTGCQVIVEAYPDEQTLLDWCKVYKLELLAEKELTEPENNLVNYWRYLLSVDDKYIWQEFNQ